MNEFMRKGTVNCESAKTFKDRDQLMKKVYQKLSEDNKFIKELTDEQRFEFLLTKVWPLSTARQWVGEVANDYQRQHSKSADRSAKYRTQAEDYIKKCEYLSALNVCTKAIRCAPFPSDLDGESNELAIAYGYRSIINFLTKDYTMALFDANKSCDLWETREMLTHKVHCLRLLRRFGEAIAVVDYIVSNEPPFMNACAVNSTNKELLKLRQQISVELDSAKDELIAITEIIESIDDQKTPTNDSIITTVKTEIDESIPYWLHPNCQLKVSDTKGRHMVASERIPFGSVIIIERPISKVLYDPTISNCTNCMKFIGDQFLPCLGCDEVIFCDEKCFAEAYNSYHQYECGITGLVFQLNSAIHHAYRLFSRFGHQTTVDYLRDHQKFDYQEYIANQMLDTDNEDNDKECPPLEKSCNVNGMERFKAFMGLADNGGKFEPSMTVYQCFRAMDCILLLQWRELLNKEYDNENIKELAKLTTNLMTIVRKVNVNVFGWAGKDRVAKGKHKGSALVVIGSLFNHSCQPNAYWSFTDTGLFTCKTIRPIEANAEINITYGPTVLTLPFVDRQKRLKHIYFFDCNCWSCLQESGQELNVRCRQCDGPLICTYHYQSQSICCLQCGQPMNDYIDVIVDIHQLKSRFDKSMIELENNSEDKSSETKAEELLSKLLAIVSMDSQPLLNCVRDLVRHYQRRQQFAKAVYYGQYFVNRMDNQLDDLLLWTQCYYAFFDKQSTLSVSDQHWIHAFSFYKSLVTVLKNKRTLALTMKSAKPAINGDSCQPLLSETDKLSVNGDNDDRRYVDSVDIETNALIDSHLNRIHNEYKQLKLWYKSGQKN